MPDLPEQHSPFTRHSFLKRWLGWRGLALLIFILILLSPVLYRGWRLGQVPATDEPFDVEAFQNQPKVPDEENAAVLLLEAAQKLVEVPEADQDAYFDEEFDGWDPGDAVLDKYLRANLPAIEIWRTAVDRSTYEMNLESEDVETQLHSFSNLRQFNRYPVNLVEKSIATGEPQSTIPWIEAMMRYAHLVRQNSSEFNVLLGTAFFAMAAEPANDWSSHPDLNRQHIMHILDAMKEARSLKPPLSENIKAGYVSNRKGFNKSIDEHIKLYRDSGSEPPLGSKWNWWLEAEPQFTARLLPHIAKNHLLFIDEHRRDRPPLIGDDLFDDSSATPALRGEISAIELEELLLESRLLQAESMHLLQGYLDAADQDEARYRCLTVALAAQAYFRDRGEFPADANELVPEYLEEIPDDLYSPTPAPVIYRRDGHGAVVYSRFENEIDNGGTEVNYEERTEFGRRPHDQGFRIRNPADRPLSASKPSRD